MRALVPTIVSTLALALALPAVAAPPAGPASPAAAPSTGARPAAPTAAPPASAVPAAPAPMPASVQKLSPAELAAHRAAAGSRVVVLDVRAPQEFAEGHVPGAINVPHDQVERRLGELEGYKDREVVVYCRSGRRAATALGVLEKAGFGQLRHLEGDMPGWTAAGQPVAKP